MKPDTKIISKDISICSGIRVGKVIKLVPGYLVYPGSLGNDAQWMSFHPGMLGQRVDENPYMYRTCGAATGRHKGLGYKNTDKKEIISYSA